MTKIVIIIVSSQMVYKRIKTNIENDENCQKIKTYDHVHLLPKIMCYLFKHFASFGRFSIIQSSKCKKT